ncbi:methyltransferase [Mesorhizobium sp. CAU 1732]|uniref:class I SAM-dependent DNA methyltransferase n=1 Tax=Mesorhizobium sp. CAU 1732 TaxID=3140358 RepID=UPI003261026F
MKKLFQSSGDLLADRRADYAEMLASSDDHAAAADLMRDALTLVPAWSAGWFRMGEMLHAAGRVAEAADAWREALRLDPSDRLGAALQLELAGTISVAGVPSSAFAETLFDQYAATFDASLVGRLLYRAPQMMSEAIARTGITTFAHAVDLGCGTGLMGERLRGIASYLEGSDISSGMLAKARDKGVYDRLEQRDLLTLEASPTKVDLVTAADVFIYLGRLERIIATVSDMLAAGGVFAFTVERHDGPEPLILRESRRYAHSERYIRDLLAANGFETAEIGTAQLRCDRNAAVEGLIVVARRAGANATVTPPIVSDDIATVALH